MASFVGSDADADRASRLTNQREQEKAQFNKTKEQLKKAAQVGLKTMDNMFQANESFAAEARFKESTVGLSSIDDFRKKRAMVDMMAQEQEQQKTEAREQAKKWAAKERKKQLNALTFDLDEDGEEQEDEEERDDKKKKKQQKKDNSDDDDKKKKKTKKNPDVETFFLKDKDREVEEARVREQLAKEWEEKQKLVKLELIEVVYSYWDGSGHRRGITVPKGTTIGTFLEKVRKECCETFHELRGMSPEQLMYIKEDLIIPHHYTFHDLIVSQARGKSGPLFHFDVHEDVRLRADARIEKDESHAGKIITRSYYERNQHIFPVNRWETYDPSKKFQEYTIKDRG